MLRILSATLLVSISFFAWSHAEHDKPRYVATDGVDTGRCDVASKPCKTIGFAASQSNKGDIVYVAKGTYLIEEASDIFYLTSSLIKVKGGYSRSDHYKKQNIKSNTTVLTGIPAEYHQHVSSKGFAPQVDMKAMSAEKQAELNLKLAAVKALGQFQKNTTCTNGMADEFPCSNMDLVSHVPLNNMSSKPPSGNDVWGHVDLNTDNEYALMGLRNGVAIFDLSDPSNPTEVGTVPGLTASWRDIKVYQYYNSSLNSWLAYAYVSTDGANNGIAIIDLNDLPNSVSLVDTDLDNSSAHNIYISNVDYSTGVAIDDYVPKLHVLGSPKYGGAHRSYSLANPEKLVAAYIPTDKTRTDYTHDGTSMVITDSRVQDQCNQPGLFCDVFIDFNEKEMRIWDQTIATETNELGSATYAGAQYVHSGWWSEDKQFIFLHDEQDELYNGINTSLYVFDVNDLTAPVLAGTWVGETKAIDHNGYVRGNRYYMSNYEKGITVLDITDPTTPVEVGHFDTFPVSQNTSFNGAWGVYPFLPSGLILASDINSGLYVLADNTRTSINGQLQLAARSFNADEGNAITFVIERVNGSVGEVSVEYQTLQLTANGQDYERATGMLTWADGDTAPKEVNVLTTLDTNDGEFSERFKFMLFNVQGGATLGQNKSSFGVINGKTNYGNVSFVEQNTTFYESVVNQQGVSEFEIALSRTGNNTGDISVTVAIDASTAVAARDDVTLISDTVNWADGELGDKSITILVNDDTEAEALEAVVLSIISSSPAETSFSSQIELQIYDDESDAAPVIEAMEALVEPSQTFPLSNSTISLVDELPDLISYEWTFVSGPETVTIENSNSIDATFSATAVGDYVLNVKVTDVFGQSANTDFTITVRVLADDTPQEQDDGGSSMSFNLLLLSLLLLAVRRFDLFSKEPNKTFD